MNAITEYVHKKDLAEMLATLLHCSAAHVEKRVITRSDFPASYQIGGQKLYKPKEVFVWIENQKVKKK